MLGRIAQSGPARFGTQFGPSHVFDVARGGLANLMGGAPLSLTRGSAAWAFNSAGVLVPFASGVPRIVPSPVGLMSVLREPQRTNKCVNYNAVPNGSLTGVSKGGDAAATLTEVDDSAALAAAGLSTVCSSGKVFKLDNSAGSTNAYASISGPTGNTNDHSFSAYVRGSGTCLLRTGYTTVADSVASALTSGYVRRVGRHSSGLTSGAKNASDVVWILAYPGAIVYFILNQLEEGAFETTPIVTAGSAVTRVRDQVSFSYAIGAASPASTFFDGVLTSSSGSPVLLGNHTGPVASWVYVQGSTNLGSMYNGTSALSTANTYTANTRLRIASSAGATGRSVCLNGGSVASDSNTMPAQPASIMRVGQLTNASDAQANAVYIHGVRMFSSELTNAQLQELTT